VKLAEGLISVGAKTSKIGGYAAPRSKRYAGQFEIYSP
jgi:allantoin racemase